MSTTDGVVVREDPTGLHATVDGGALDIPWCTVERLDTRSVEDGYEVTLTLAPGGQRVVAGSLAHLRTGQDEVRVLLPHTPEWWAYVHPIRAEDCR